jgi:hypothetical protein
MSSTTASFERGADDIIRCPSCAAEHVCLVTMDFGGDGDTQDIECACGNAFELTCHVKVTFTATSMEGK